MPGVQHRRQARCNRPPNSLWTAFRDTVAAIRPAYLIIENVEGLLVMEKGKIRDAIFESFAEIGYQMDCRLLAPRSTVYHSSANAPYSSDGSTALPRAFPHPVRGGHVSVGEAIFDLPTLKVREKAVRYDKEPQTPYQRARRKDCTILTNHEAAHHSPDLARSYQPYSGWWQPQIDSGPFTAQERLPQQLFTPGQLEAGSRHHLQTCASLPRPARFTRRSTAASLSARACGFSLSTIILSFTGHEHLSICKSATPCHPYWARQSEPPSWKPIARTTRKHCAEREHPGSVTHAGRRAFLTTTPTPAPRLLPGKPASRGRGRVRG